MEGKSNSHFDGPLAPRIGFNNSIQNPIPRSAQPEQSYNANQGGGGRNYKKFLPIGAVALALLVLPLTLSQLNQTQDVRQRAAEITRFPTQVIPSPTPFPSPTDIPTITPTPTVTPTEVPLSRFQAPRIIRSTIAPTP